MRFALNHSASSSPDDENIRMRAAPDLGSFAPLPSSDKALWLSPRIITLYPGYPGYPGTAHAVVTMTHLVRFGPKEKNQKI